jgi:hypothetical protein
LRDGLLITAPEAFAVLIPLPRGNGRIAVLIAVVGVGTAVAIEIPVRTFYSLLIAATLDIGESVQNYPPSMVGGSGHLHLRRRLCSHLRLGQMSDGNRVSSTEALLIRLPEIER